MAVGLLLIRVVLGLLLVGHGTQKLFGWFGGGGLAFAGPGGYSLDRLLGLSWSWQYGVGAALLALVAALPLVALRARWASTPPAEQRAGLRSAA